MAGRVQPAYTDCVARAAVRLGANWDRCNRANEEQVSLGQSNEARERYHHLERRRELLSDEQRLLERNIVEI